MAPKLTPQIKIIIENLVNEGLNNVQICEKLGISYATLSRQFRKTGGRHYYRADHPNLIPKAYPKRNCRRHSDKDIQKIYELFSKGIQSTKISKLVGLPQATVYRIMRLMEFFDIENMSEERKEKTPYYFQLMDYRTFIEKLKDIKLALGGGDEFCIREDLIQQVFEKEGFSSYSRTRSTINRQQVDGTLSNEFNNRLTSMQMQIDILTETIMEIKNGKNN